MRHGSLFSGIGGFDLAAEWMGWENVFHCEWNPFGQKVLKHYWPKAINYEDITKTDFTIHRGKIDILTGGFPCQPYSSAGKRLGKEDERHLWPEMLRAIREIQPRWVVGENVFGLVNWSEGLVFHEVQTDLEAEGYEVQSYVLPAVSVNAPHRRDRIWFVAYSNCNGLNKEWRHDCGSENDEWSKEKVFRSANTKEFDGFNTFG
jgi:DNA (cytosine-5)-methyltransferase 1